MAAAPARPSRATPAALTWPGRATPTGPAGRFCVQRLEGRPGAAEDGDVGDGSSTAARDVLPRGVRRRLGRTDAVLAAVLVGELLAGTAAGAAWQVRDDLARAWVPDVPRAATAPAAPAPPQAATTWVVVAPPAAPAPPPPPRRTVPRDPFEVQLP